MARIPEPLGHQGLLRQSSLLLARGQLVVSAWQFLEQFRRFELLAAGNPGETLAKVLGVQFDPCGRALEAIGCLEDGTGTSKGVEDSVAGPNTALEEVLVQGDWFLCSVGEVFVSAGRDNIWVDVSGLLFPFNRVQDNLVLTTWALIWKGNSA